MNKSANQTAGTDINCILGRVSDRGARFRLSGTTTPVHQQLQPLSSGRETSSRRQNIASSARRVSLLEHRGLQAPLPFYTGLIGSTPQTRCTAFSPHPPLSMWLLHTRSSSTLSHMPLSPFVVPSLHRYHPCQDPLHVFDCLVVDESTAHRKGANQCGGVAPSCPHPSPGPESQLR